MKEPGTGCSANHRVLHACAVLAMCISLCSCGGSGQMTASDDTFFKPLKSVGGTTVIKREETEEAKKLSSWDQKADSLLKSQQEQERRLRALTTQLELLQASRRGSAPDSAQAVKKGQSAAAEDLPRRPAPASPSYESALRSFASGRYREAVETVQALLRRGAQKEREDECHYLLGASYYGLGQYADAVVVLKRVIDSVDGAKKADAYLVLGRTYKQTGDLQQAKLMFEAVIRESPRSSLANAARLELKDLATKR